MRLVRPWLRQAQKKPANPDLIEGLLPDGNDFMLLVGRPGIGKTNMSLNIAYCLATGTSFFGFACQKVKVGYLGFEGSDHKLAKRVEKIQQNFPDPAGNLYIQVGGLFKLPRQPQKFKAVTNGLRVIIIDPLRYMVQGDYCKPENAAQFISSLHDLCVQQGVAAIICHHVRKRKENLRLEPGDLDSIKGATDYADTATSVLLLERAHQARNPKGKFALIDPDKVTLYFAKARDAIADIPPKNLRLNRQKLLFEEV